jgi:hypothetical protein
MESEPSIEILEKTLERMLYWIAAADNKVAPVLAIDTAMLGIVAAIAPKPEAWNPAAVITTAIALALLFSSLALLFYASFPRTHGPKGSLVFFGGITERERSVFVAEITSLKLSQYCEDLAIQCYRNAQIAGLKYRYVRLAMTMLLAAILPWMLTVYILYSVAGDRFLS